MFRNVLISEHFHSVLYRGNRLDGIGQQSIITLGNQRLDHLCKMPLKCTYLYVSIALSQENAITASALKGSCESSVRRVSRLCHAHRVCSIGVTTQYLWERHSVRETGENKLVPIDCQHLLAII